jgi:hypothetical protein
MALLFSQYKMIDCLTKQISKYESLSNNNKKEGEESKLKEELGREVTSEYIRKN